MSQPSNDATVGATLLADGSTPTRTPSPSLARGEAIGRYLILGELGSGAMGKVYAAYDPELDRKLAIKLLHATEQPGSIESQPGGSRLQREAQALAKLSHPNVVGVHDVGNHRGRVFVAMEFVAGGTLEAWMQAGPHAWREVLANFIPAGRGLAAAHELGLIHRDFKPANVLLGSDGRVRVADFGLARRSDHAPSPRAAKLPRQLSEPSFPPVDELRTAADADSLSMRLTQTGAFVGTPAYMAPEQYADDLVDARADQFGFCVALWEALFGQRPFVGDNPAALAFSIHRGELTEPPPSAQAVPGWLRRAVERGLANDPEQRWPDMQALIDALRHDPAVMRRRVLVGLSLVGLIALTIGLTRLWSPPAQESPPLCEGAEQAFDAGTQPDARDVLSVRYAKISAPWTADSQAYLLARLDGWRAAWEQGWTEACSATRIRGEQSEELLDKRMLCLERRRARLSTFVSALADTSDAQLRGAIQHIDDIGDVADCADSEFLSARVPPPADADERREYEALLATLDEVLSLDAVGHWSAAEAKLEESYAPALALGHPDLVAEASFAKGNHLHFVKETEAEPELRKAFVAGLEAGRFDVSQRAARRISSLLVLDDARLDEAAHWVESARAIAEYLDHDGMRVSTFVARGRMLRYRGDSAGAIAVYEQALELSIAHFGADHQRSADLYFNLSAAQFVVGRLDEAIANVERARELWSVSAGPMDSRTLAALNARGVFAMKRGNNLEASRLFELLIERQKQLLGPDHIKLASVEFNYGALLGDNYDPRAVEMLTRVTERYTREYGADNMSVAQAKANLAIAMGRTHPQRIAEALVLIDEARTMVESKREPGSPEVIIAQALTVELLRRSGALQQALSASEALGRSLDESEEELEGVRADYAVEHAHVLNDLGHHEAALASLAVAEDIARHDIEASGARKSVDRLLAKARALRALGREEEALREVERARLRWRELPQPMPTDELLARLRSWD